MNAFSKPIVTSWPTTAIGCEPKLEELTQDPRNPSGASLQLSAIFILLATLVLWIPLLASRSADSSYLLPFSMDEHAFIQDTFETQQQLKEGRFAEVLQTKLQWKCGYIFQIAYAIGTFPFFLADSYTGVLLCARLISALFFGLSIFYVYRLNLLFLGKSWVSMILALSLLFMPGLFVFQKFFAPDQMSRCFWVMSFYYLCRDDLSFRRDFVLACILQGIAISIRLPAVIGGFGFATAILLSWLSNRNILQALKQCLKGLILVGGTFLVSNFPAFTSISNFKQYLGELTWVHSEYEQAPAMTLPGRMLHWFSIVDEHYLIYAMQAVVVIGLIAAIGFTCWSPRYRAHRNRLLILAAVLMVGMLINFVLVKQFLYWHLAPFFSLVLCGIAVLYTVISQGHRRIANVMVCGFAIALMATNGQSFWKQMQARLTEHQTLEFARWQTEMYATQERVLELSRESESNPESLDILACYHSAEDMMVYQAVGLRTKLVAQGRFQAAITRDFPLVAILDLRHPRYEDWTDKKISKISQALNKLRTSPTGHRYRYELAQSTGKRYVFQRVDASAPRRLQHVTGLSTFKSLAVFFQQNPSSDLTNVIDRPPALIAEPSALNERNLIDVE